MMIIIIVVVVAVVVVVVILGPQYNPKADKSFPIRNMSPGSIRKRRLFKEKVHLLT